MNNKNNNNNGDRLSPSSHTGSTRVLIHSVADPKAADLLAEVMRQAGCDILPYGESRSFDSARLQRQLDKHEQDSAGHLLVIDAGLTIEPSAANKLITLMDCQLQSHPEAVILTALTNAQSGMNPFTNIRVTDNTEPGFERLQKLVALLGPGRVHEPSVWPRHLLFFSAGAVNILAKQNLQPGNELAILRQQGGRLVVSDDLFIPDSRRPVFEQEEREIQEEFRPAAWGQLKQRLDRWLRSDLTEFSTTRLDGLPVTLHVTHSWGGGVARWINSFIADDAEGLNFQLCSEGPQSGKGAGQRLSLYLGNKTDSPVASWWLQAPIRSTVTEHAQYRAIIDEIRRRYRVGRIVVSSLVGHSLDILRCHLPTIQVLHDFYPAWPLLGVHPGPYLNRTEKQCLNLALEEHQLLIDFQDQDANTWNTLARTWFDTVSAAGVSMVAPSQSVASMLRQLDSSWKSIEITIIPHGLPPLPISRPVEPRQREDGRIRLVIPGRVQEGKGRDLLLAALPELTQFAHVTLVGAGKQGEVFFGRSGVDVILQYRNEELPELLATIGPHVAGLLSVVPETFSYTLSEMHYLNIPVLATRVGSFEERIIDGETGWLIEPTPESLIAAVKQLFEQRTLISDTHTRLAELEFPDVAQMISSYGDLCAAEPVSSWLSSKETDEATNLDATVAESFAFERVELDGRLRELSLAVETLQDEVEERTHWAEERQRVLEEEQEERELHVASLNQQLEKRVTELQEARDAFAWAQSATQEAEDELHKNRELLAQYWDEKEEYRLNLDRTRSELEQTRVTFEQAREAFERDQAEAERALKQTQDALQLRHDQYAQLKATHDWVLSSSSWRITRPFRVGRRILGNLLRAQLWNPLRWPLLLSQLVRTLNTQGIRGALKRAQVSPQVHSAPEVFEAEQVEDIGSPDGPETLPVTEQPDVSIIIPVFNKWEFTAACLRSLAEIPSRASVEVIVVDDQSSDETPTRLEMIEGLITVRNEENLGFIGSCNKGAQRANGRYLVMLNNDTQVVEGWLDALLDTFQQFPDTGMVGARLVYPDGKLQEDGGIIFSDGSGWNYGRGDDPDKPEYQYVREVDYCSGACIMLEKKVFDQLNGFDTHYSPAYYEDTDLAFRVRQLGLKVRVQPRSTIVHHEGVSSGTDVAAGVKQYQVVNCQKFLERWQQELAGYPAPLSGPDDLAALRKARDHRLKGRILVIDAYTPEPDQDSGSLRLRYLLQCMQDLGYGVTFFAENRGHAGVYTTDLQQEGVEVIYNPWLESLHTFFKERGNDFDFIMISRHYVAMNFISLIERYCPRARFIFDTVDLHYLRETRLAELEDSLPLKRVAAQTRRSELAVIEAADATLVVSPVEKSVLGKDAPDARVHVISNVHKVVGSQKTWSERKDIFFVGGYQHPPNVDAATWFVTSIWPLVRAELPDIRFHLIGSKAPEKISSLHGNGVEFHGFVKSLDPWLDGCRLAVAPLRYGAGVKGKVNISMSRGQPVVATPMAVEGMFVTSGKEVLVAETEQEFAGAIVRLYQDEPLWEEISRAGLENVQQYFSVETAKRSLQGLLDDLK